MPVIVCDRDAIAVEAFGAGEADVGRDAVEGAFTVGAGDVAVLAVSMFHDEPLTFSAREELLARLEGTADRWRKRMERCSYDGPWAEAVRRSGLTLDLLIDASTGAMVAAPTMALPERIGGSRNYDYRYAWVRDGNLTLEAMQRLRFAEEVHLSLTWMLGTVRTTAPRLQPMYGLDGSTEIPDRTLPLPGYLGSRPVLLGNGAADQLQLGNFGDLLDMALKFCAGGNAIGLAEGAMLATVADRVCRVWRDEDSGIWELPRLRGYTQSKLACWLALEHAAELADLRQLPGDGAARWRREADAVARRVRERCWSEGAGAYVRADDGADELDAAVLLAGRGSFFRGRAGALERDDRRDPRAARRGRPAPVPLQRDGGRGGCVRRLLVLARRGARRRRPARRGGRGHGRDGRAGERRRPAGGGDRSGDRRFPRQPAARSQSPLARVGGVRVPSMRSRCGPTVCPGSSRGGEARLEDRPALERRPGARASAAGHGRRARPARRAPRHRGACGGGGARRLARPMRGALS